MLASEYRVLLAFSIGTFGFTDGFNLVNGEAVSLTSLIRPVIFATTTIQPMSRDFLLSRRCYATTPTPDMVNASIDGNEIDRSRTGLGLGLGLDQTVDTVVSSSSRQTSVSRGDVTKSTRYRTMIQIGIFHSVCGISDL